MLTVAPVVDDNESPEGRAPPTIDHVGVPNAPVSVNGAEYATPAVMAGKDTVVMVSADVCEANVVVTEAVLGGVRVSATTKVTL